MNYATNGVLIISGRFTATSLYRRPTQWDWLLYEEDTLREMGIIRIPCSITADSKVLCRDGTDNQPR
jgi:hypothetical protein